MSCEKEIRDGEPGFLSLFWFVLEWEKVGGSCCEGFEDGSRSAHSVRKGLPMMLE